MDGESINQFRENMRKMFAEGLGVTIIAGKLEGPNQFGEWRGSLWLDRVQEDPARVMEQQIYMSLRVWAPFLAVRSPNDAYDPAPLEEMADKILAVIGINQTGLGAWFQRVTAIDFDPVNQGLQARILAYASNPGVS